MTEDVIRFFKIKSNLSQFFLLNFLQIKFFSHTTLRSDRLCHKYTLPTHINGKQNSVFIVLKNKYFAVSAFMQNKEILHFLTYLHFIICSFKILTSEHSRVTTTIICFRNDIILIYLCICVFTSHHSFLLFSLQCLFHYLPLT